jgi:hypothetical protein
MQHLFRILLSACLLLTLPAGAGALETHPVRDIRKVVVSGDASASPTVLKRTGEHLRAAARATRRPVTLERAQMDVRVSRVVFGADGHNSAQVTITLSGTTDARTGFTVNSFLPQGRGRDAALAEAIARRVALAYNLAPAKVAKATGKRPGKGRKHAGRERRTVSRSSVHAYAGANTRPLVIPTEAALTVRSRALPPGSKKKVAPCVATRKIACP